MAKKPVEWHRVAWGPQGQVILSTEAKLEYDKIQEGNDSLRIRQRTALRKFMEKFCHSPEHLNDQQLKKEQNVSDGVGGKVAIWTFKPWQWRLYGSIFAVDRLKTFMGVVVDPHKKKDKADKAKLDRAGLIIGQTDEYKRHRGELEKKR